MKILEESLNIVWEEKVSKNGKKYHVGYPSDEAKLEILDVNGEFDKKSFNVDVYWPATDNDNWVLQDGAFITKTGISRYYLNEDRPWYKVYKKILEFTAQEHYDYYFTDEAGDIYECNVYRNGNHYVQYNSDKPNIIHIKGD